MHSSSVKFFSLFDGSNIFARRCIGRIYFLRRSFVISIHKALSLGNFCIWLFNESVISVKQSTTLDITSLFLSKYDVHLAIGVRISYINSTLFQKKLSSNKYFLVAGFSAFCMDVLSSTAKICNAYFVFNKHSNDNTNEFQRV